MCFLNVKQKIYVGILMVIYIIFLLGDFWNIFNTNNFKFISIILCFFMTFNYKEYISKKDILLLRVAKFLTIITDYLLLFTNYFFYGVCIFSIIQIIYIYRHNGTKNKSKGDYILKSLLVVIISISILNFLGFFKNENMLIITSIYSILIIGGTIIAYLAPAYYKENYINRKLVFYGMFLFLLCDINVGVSNLSNFGLFSEISNNIKNYSFDLIWLFYLPSQIILSMSGRKY
ncbi:lysoplasmalogenase family protein [Clostridium grantii]|uniref:YhhN-like protein n=1 Tax=Clostridium grantii DSM 8605 TaxID=1121316 RepID=A0A1M5RUJ7_9CLOT|nr:lysoplasmalogenase family protein [Clostridium grantii]SHH29503.1 YhhN-like protein [Clostridium grantii DSM 8605]